MFFLEKYKIKKIKEINFNFEKYLTNYKKTEKTIYILKKIYINFKMFKFKGENNKMFFFKKFFRNFIDIHKDLV
jgi:hypothetical protein